MTNAGRVCVLMVLFYAAQAGILAGSDFFCRDPDTGNLHAANTTWPSTTFCGNYTCKLRMKNITTTEYAPFRQINVTKTNYFRKILEKQPKISEIIDRKIDENLRDDKDNSKMNEDGGTEGRRTDAEPEADRYLTDKEIKTISEILHLMKKSDLDAIIDIYKFAQDIYKEIDTSGIEDIVAEVEKYRQTDTVEKAKTNDVNVFNVRAHSYWNDPAFTNTRPSDMDTQGTNIITSVTQPKKDENYFIGQLISTDFRKYPYYFPVSSFQGMSTYNIYPPGLLPTLNVPQNLKKFPTQKLQKDIRPSIYLPYPFSYIHNNNYKHSTHKLNTSYSTNFDKYSLYNQNKLPYVKTYLTQVPNTVLVKKHPAKDVKEHAKSTEKGHEEVLKGAIEINREEIPDWHTSPLAVDVLEEVKAHALEKAKILRPFRKKVKLERVGKLIKLDVLSRNKREAAISQESIKDVELYEVLLEKTTCSSNDTVPGYFRHGNLSHPFPECCPQRIGTR